MISVSRVLFSKDEENAVLAVLRSGQVVGGEEVRKFEEEFAKYIGSKYAIAVVNGTAALHLALLALKIGRDAEVITTPYSFIASTNAILYVGATPVFVDVNHDYNINVEKIEEKITPKTKAILPVHLFGNPCDMDKILSIAEKHNLIIVEDACQAHGAEFKGKKVGTFGTLACFSFYATKNMTTIEGGMITTDNEELYEYLTMARSHGSIKKYYHEFLGYNYRLTDVQAAIGRVQLKKLSVNNEKRIRNALYLNKGLDGVEGLSLPFFAQDKKHVFHQYTVTVSKEFPVNRDRFLDILAKKHIGYSINYPISIHNQRSLLKMGYNTSKLEVAEQLNKQTVSLPVHPHLTKKDLNHIIATIRGII